ncbi:MAG TPA: helicase-associated domain-containing protein [Pseudonocardiaceae bacterium]|nr:helicase-associated domain-containing protein [Pseudonocardiaceae bacterium]
MPPTALAQWLRSLDDDALVALLRARPDLAVPPPADTSVLATRAGIRASVARACEDLDTFTLTVFEALLVAYADLAPVPLDTVRRLLGPDVAAERTVSAVDVLRERALAWGDDAAIATTPAAREVVATYPGGLGRSVPELAGFDPAGVAPEELRVLHALAKGPPIGRTRDAGAAPQPGGPVQRLLDRGLLVRVDAGTVELPREVGLALRGRHPMGQVAVDEPPLPTASHAMSTVDAAAAGEVLDLLRRTEKLIEAWTAEPPPVLRAGGIGVRDVRRLARLLELDDACAGLLAEIVAGAGLVDSSEGGDPQWTPTTLADAWLDHTPEQRWVSLAAAWLDLPRLPGLAGARDERDRPLAPLSDELRRPLAPRDRRWVLDALAGLPPGAGVTDRAGLAAVLAWRAPRRGGRLRDDLVDWTLREAGALGVIALGALTSFGRAILAGDRPAAVAALRRALPDPVDHVLVQADLTVVAPGPLGPSLAAELAQVADVESAGGATVFRVGEPSIRRALDAGRSADDLHELFRSRSATPVPQGLSYLIDDVARRHGRLRGGTAGSFLRCDDPALLAEVLAHRDTEAALLRRIAPTVLVSPRSLTELLDVLRSAGFAPVAEGVDGQVVTLRQVPRRIAARPRVYRHTALPVPGDDRLAPLVRQVRAGDEASRIGTGAHRAPASADDTLALLRGAARARCNVWIGYVDANGVASRCVVEPIRVGAGVLEGLDHTRGTVRRFMLHRITSAAVVD